MSVYAGIYWPHWAAVSYRVRHSPCICATRIYVSVYDFELIGAFVEHVVAHIRESEARPTNKMFIWSRISMEMAALNVCVCVSVSKMFALNKAISTYIVYSIYYIHWAHHHHCIIRLIFWSRETEKSENHKYQLNSFHSSYSWTTQRELANLFLIASTALDTHLVFEMPFLAADTTHGLWRIY